MTAYHDLPYFQLADYVLTHGVDKSNRTGVNARGIFGHQMRFDLRDGTIPMLTSKKMHIHSIIVELLWYLLGTGNIQALKDNKVTIWDEWADENGELGPVYGVMWRRWPTFEYHVHPEAKYMSANDWGDAWFPGDDVDQIGRLIDLLKTNPNDRRLLVTSWNPALLPDPSKTFSDNVADGKQALPPCHYSFQCYAKPLTLPQRVRLFNAQYDVSDMLAEDDLSTVEQRLTDANIPSYELSLMLNQRSCDVGLGVPFNIVQYSMLLRMIAHVVNMAPGEFIWNGGDIHVYENHVDALKLQLTREPFASPTLTFARNVASIDDFTYDDFIISGYQSHPAVKMKVAV